MLLLIPDFGFSYSVAAVKEPARAKSATATVHITRGALLSLWMREEV